MSYIKTLGIKNIKEDPEILIYLSGDTEAIIQNPVALYLQLIKNSTHSKLAEALVKEDYFAEAPAVEILARNREQIAEQYTGKIREFLVRNHSNFVFKVLEIRKN